MLEIDGARHSGSGTIVRQAVAFAALTGQAVHLRHVRVRRPNPGLRPQHLQVVEAIRQLVDGTTEGVRKGAQEFVFIPGLPQRASHYTWDIGSAGSTTMLALAVLPVLAFRSAPIDVTLQGGIFQDFAPSVYHLQHVVLPLLWRMGVNAVIDMSRPGYVPRGGGVLHLRVSPGREQLRPLVMQHAGAVRRLWGVALASHLAERRVSQRLAMSAQKVFTAAGYTATIETLEDSSALQPGAAFTAFADIETGTRLGADQAGAPRRRAEAIGTHVAQQLLAELRTGAPLDRYAADQVIPFAALAEGESRCRLPWITDHVLSNAWLAKEMLGAEVRLEDRELVVTGVGFRSPAGL